MDVVVIMTGVLSRGVRDTGPTGFNSVQKHLISPAKSMGVSIRLWAFNNVPSMIDGGVSPPDGARSLYPEFDHYVEIPQENIDSSDKAKKLRNWLWKSVFVDSHCYGDRPGPVGEYCVNELQPNIVRLEYMEELAMDHLATEVKAGRVLADAIILFMSPEMVIPAFDLQLLRWVTQKAEEERMLVLKIPESRVKFAGAPCHDGLVCGSSLTILHWWVRKKNPTTRHCTYEHWFADSLRGIVCRPIGFCQERPRHRYYKPNDEEDLLPWCSESS